MLIFHSFLIFLSHYNFITLSDHHTTSVCAPFFQTFSFSLNVLILSFFYKVNTMQNMLMITEQILVYLHDLLFDFFLFALHTSRSKKNLHLLQQIFLMFLKVISYHFILVKLSDQILMNFYYRFHIRNIMRSFGTNSNTSVHVAFIFVLLHISYCQNLNNWFIFDAFERQFSNFYSITL